MDVLIRIAAVLLYVAGCASTIVLSKKYHKKLYPYSLAVTGLAIIILGFLPEHMNAVVGLYPIFFAMAFQWNSFPGAYGYNASCIFSTNNCRQIANALTEYSITHEKKLLKKAWFFSGTVLCFHLGVAFSWLTHYFIGIRSVWLCVIPLAVSAVLIYWEAQLDKQPEPSVCKKIPAAMCVQVAKNIDRLSPPLRSPYESRALSTGMSHPGTTVPAFLTCFLL